MIKSDTFYINKEGQRKQRQKWEIGQSVNVGFLKGLKVIQAVTVIDGLPDIYTLEAASGARYEFIPHNGLHRIN